MTDQSPLPVPRRATAPDPVVSILVVSYNTRAMTLDCLRSIAAETRTPHEVIVVDNASPDGSAAAIAEAFPAAVLLAEAANHGFAAANNLAARHARGEYLLLLNPDTVVLDRALDRLLAFAREKPEAMIWGGRTLFADMSLNPDSCWQRLTLWNSFCRVTGLTAIFPDSGLFNAERYGGWQRDSVRAVDIVQGSLLMIRRATWETLGGFDPAFFMYGEEADLCLRARRLGADPHITPEASIIHYGAASDTVRADRMERLLAAKMGLIRRHFPPWQRPLGELLFSLWPLSRLIATRAAATVTGSPELRATSEVWAEVWARRRRWKKGY